MARFMQKIQRNIYQTTQLMGYFFKSNAIKKKFCQFCWEEKKKQKKTTQTQKTTRKSALILDNPNT